MFRLARLSDVVHLPPSSINTPLPRAVQEHIALKYTDRVVPNLGLAVAIYDLEQLGDAQLRQGSPEHHVSVKFRLVVFCPLVGEILTGTIVASDKFGITISMGFFNDIFVPARRLHEFTSWSEEEELFVWNVNGGDDKLYFDLENEARFKVTAVHFRQQSSQRLDERGACATSNSSEMEPAMKVVASMDVAGLGLLHWWPPGES